jgi:hypothetical protein
MLRFHDKLPVLTLPDGRLALADTGCNGAELVTNREQAPVSVNGRSIQPTVTSVDLDGIAMAIGAPNLGMLVGVNLLHE